MAEIIGRIYKITSRECDEVYIGSTTLQLNERLREHKHSYKSYLNGNHNYMTSFNIIRFATAKIRLIHEGVFEDRKALERLEGLTIKSTPNCVNKICVGRTKREYYEDNRDAIIQRVQKRYENKLQEIKAWQMTKEVCVACGNEYTLSNKARHMKSKKHLDCIESSDED